MSIIRTTAISALALFTLAATTADAFAGHRHRIWPRVYVPFFSDYGDSYDSFDRFYNDDEDVVVYPRRHRNRDIVRDYYDENELEPVYQPPAKKVVKPKKKTAVAKPAKKSTTSPSSAAIIVKPKVKPVKTASVTATETATETGVTTKSAVSSASKPLPDFQVNGGIEEVAPVTTLSTKTSVPATATSKPVTPAAKATTPPLTTASVKPAAPAPASKATAPATTKVASAASPAATAATPKGAIACSKGAEIVSGYGFTSVKPKVCNGVTYSFNASRAANAYVIKVSSATGEITDVQKVK